MNVYGAAQRDDGRWEFCCASPERGVHAVGYCAGLRYAPSPMRRLAEEMGNQRLTFYFTAADRQTFHDSGHATADEARECYLRFLISRVEFVQPTTIADRCRCAWPLCDARTAGFARIGHEWHAYLCLLHQHTDYVEKLLANFNVERVSSW